MSMQVKFMQDIYFTRNILVANFKLFVLLPFLIGFISIILEEFWCLFVGFCPFPGRFLLFSSPQGLKV